LPTAKEEIAVSHHGGKILRVAVRKDIALSGVEFSEGWQDRVMHPFGPFTIPFIDKQPLIRNKRAVADQKFSQI